MGGELGQGAQHNLSEETEGEDGSCDYVHIESLGFFYLLSVCLSVCLSVLTVCLQLCFLFDVARHVFGRLHKSRLVVLRNYKFTSMAKPIPKLVYA